jgi:hypothetical protein
MTLLFTLTKKPPHFADYKKSLQFAKESENSPTNIKSISFVAGTDRQPSDRLLGTHPKIKHISISLKADKIPLDGLTDAIKTICQYTFPSYHPTDQRPKVARQKGL